MARRHAHAELREASGGEILFVDCSVPDIETVFHGLRPGVEAILLDAARPAAAQMAAALAERRDLDAVHVMAHGAPGEVRFAAGTWSAETLAAEAGELSVIGNALGA